jgi:hypothetical protein
MQLNSFNRIATSPHFQGNWEIDERNITRRFGNKAKALRKIGKFKAAFLHHQKVIESLPDFVTLTAETTDHFPVGSSRAERIKIEINVPERREWALDSKVGQFFAFESMEHLVGRAIKKAQKTLKSLEELRAADAAIKKMTVETVSTGKSKAAAILPSDELNDDDVLSQLSTDR